jgi:hypothetical protein
VKETAGLGEEMTRLEKAIAGSMDGEDRAIMEKRLAGLRKEAAPLVEENGRKLEERLEACEKRMQRLIDKKETPAIRHGAEDSGQDRTTDPEPPVREAEKAQFQKGQRVTFTANRVTGSGAGKTLTGYVVDANDRIVTLRCGTMKIPLLLEKGTVTPAPELKYEETKEYAKERAQKHAGENGKVCLAKVGEDVAYNGPIVELTPTFALQKTDRDTLILHRLKDLSEIPRAGADCVIRKDAGRGLGAVRYAENTGSDKNMKNMKNRERE